MSKTIKEIADELDVSKETVRKRIKDISPTNWRKIGNKLAIDDDGVSEIYQLFKGKSPKNNANQNANQSPTNEYYKQRIAELEKDKQSLQEYILQQNNLMMMITQENQKLKELPPPKKGVVQKLKSLFTGEENE